MPQARDVDWGIVITRATVETPGLSVKRVDTTGI